MPEASLATMATDEDLVHQAREGDPSARQELFRRHWDAANRVAYRLLGNEQDAQDATQDGMIKALGHLDDFDGRSRFRTWLFKIVTNAAYDAGRRRKRQTTLGIGSIDRENGGNEPALENDPARNLRREDLRKTLDAALAKLPWKQRETFVLFAEGGLSYLEIAGAQDIPIGTVMSRISNARAKLQSYLDGVEGL
jgi:RNA polymerase sigma-70 factor (ECF subfamily)